MYSKDLIACDDISFCQRESFNNAILLTTMVKSTCYYIIGFSREEGVVTIAFDFSSATHAELTKEVNISFYGSKIKFEAELQNTLESLNIPRDNYFLVKNGKIAYSREIDFDGNFPIGYNQLHNEIMQTKNQIIMYLEKLYKIVLSNWDC